MNRNLKISHPFRSSTARSSWGSFPSSFRPSSREAESFFPFLFPEGSSFFSFEEGGIAFPGAGDSFPSPSPFKCRSMSFSRSGTGCPSGLSLPSLTMRSGSIPFAWMDLPVGVKQRGGGSRPPQQDRPSMVLKRSRDNLRRGGGAGIHQHHHREPQVGSFLPCEVLELLVFNPAVRVDDETRIDELVGHLHRLVEEPSRIVPKVQHHAFPVALYLGQYQESLLQFAVGV